MSALVSGRQLELKGRLSRTDLDLRAGELVCLIGPNGSGKTSLLHALAGIGSPSGQVLVDGVDPALEPPSRRIALLSYLSASREIAWPLIARDLVGLGLPASVGPDRVEAILALFDLKHLAGRRVDRLSTGERSRLLIARALAPDSSLLLLDEPTANLDPLWQLRLMDELRARLKGPATSTLVALHDLDLARVYADRLLVIDNGRIVADGTSAEVLAGETIAAVFGIRPVDGGWRPMVQD